MFSYIPDTHYCRISNQRKVMPTYAHIITSCALLLLAKNGYVAGQDCPPSTNPAVLTAASGTIQFPTNIQYANCAWRIAAATGPVNITVIGLRGQATDDVRVYNGFDNYSFRMFSSFTSTYVNFTATGQSTQRYVYVTYKSTTSYGYYSLTYNQLGASSGGSSTMRNAPSANGIICVALLLLLNLTRGAAISQSNQPKLA